MGKPYKTLSLNQPTLQLREKNIKDKDLFSELRALVTDLTKHFRIIASTLEVEAWHEVGATDEPAFASGWVNMDGDHETAAFYKDPFGVVHCKGAIKSGTIGHAEVFIFPDGYRPSKDLHFPAIDFTELPAAYLHVDYVTGALHIPAGDNRGIALDTIHFRV